MLLSWQLCSQNHGLGSRGRAAATKPLLGLMLLSLRLALQALKYGGTLLAEKFHISLHGFLSIFLKVAWHFCMKCNNIFHVS